MVLADSSVWIDYLRGAQTDQANRLDQLLDAADMVMGDLVLIEILQGIRSDRQFDRTLEKLRLLPLIAIATPDIAVEAAGNYRRLRALGITVRKTVDTLIATRCIMDGLPLLYSDRDFDPFVEHLGLRNALANS